MCSDVEGKCISVAGKQSVVLLYTNFQPVVLFIPWSDQY